MILSQNLSLLPKPDNESPQLCLVSSHFTFSVRTDQKVFSFCGVHWPEGRLSPDVSQWFVSERASSPFGSSDITFHSNNWPPFLSLLVPF